MSSRCPREARRQPGPEESGVIAVLSAIGASALLACVALAMNLGNIAQTHQHAQSAVDAAALTGADLLGQGASPSSVVPVVEENVAENFHSADLAVGSPAWDTCAPPPSGFSAPSGMAEDCVTFGSADAVRVQLPPHLLAETFAGVTGVASAPIRADGAAVAPPGVAPCAICVIGQNGTTLQANGNAELVVNDAQGDAGIAVDSGSDPAVSLVGNVFVQAPSVGVVGSISTSGNVGFSVPPETGIAPFADPLAYLRPPDPAGLADQGSISLSGNNTVQLSPGIYGSIRLSGNSEVTLAPGLYILTGGFEASGNTEVQGAGVTLYFTCGSAADPTACQPGQASGGLAFTGNGLLDLSPPTAATCEAIPDTCPYVGLTVFMDRNDPSGITLTGNGLGVSGTLYAASGSLVLSGNGESLGSMIDVADLTVSGNGSVTVDYNASDNVALPRLGYLCAPSASGPSAGGC
jgi:hypothetical protein